MSQPLRILQVASHAKVARGGAVQMIRLADALRRRGHHLHCVVHRPRSHTRTLEHDFSELFDADLPVTAYDQERWGEICRFRHWLCENPFDILHAHRDRALALAFLATRGMAKPLLIANRGTAYPIPRWTWARRAFRSRRVVAVTAVAEAVRQALIEQDGLAPEKIHTVYGSVDIERFDPDISGAAIRREIQIADDAPLIAMPAALVPKKGHRDFVAMMPHVLAAVPDAHFLWVGEGKQRRFDRVVEPLQNRERLHWLGHRDDIPEILAACSVVVCCSTRGEGLTGVLREALAMARPVITTDVAGNAEIVQDGATGRVVPVGDPEAMVRAIIATLREPEHAERLARAGRQWVLEHCSGERRAERIEALYRSCLGQSVSS